MRHGFPPLIGDAPKLLVLGTFPSPLSRERGEYYGNPRNLFWKLILEIFGAEFAAPDYVEKQRLIFANGVAVWDVVKSCEIEGALDKNIREPVFNVEIPELVRRRGVARILFNGAAACELYRRGIGLPTVDWRRLPSTSPANAGMSYEQKRDMWRDAFER